jgi:hypothetical protein
MPPEKPKQAPSRDPWVWVIYVGFLVSGPSLGTNEALSIYTQIFSLWRFKGKDYF